MEINVTSTREYIVFGEMLVIDPHYILDDETYKNLENNFFNKKGTISSSIILNFNDIELFMFPSAWGDGNYNVKIYGKLKGEVITDSGIIAIISKKNADKLSKDLDSGLFVNINDKDEIFYEGNGVLTGPIEIDTYEDKEDDWMNDREFEEEE